MSMMIRFTTLSLMLAACNGDKGGLIVYNTAPSASIQTPVNGSAFDEKTSVSFQAIVSDGQDSDENLTVLWGSDVDGALEGDFTVIDGLSTFSSVSLSPGNHVISIKVTDSRTASSSDQVAITINDLPEIPSIEVARPITNESGLEGVEFEFKAKVVDAYDPVELLTVSFASSIDGEFCAPAADASGIASCLFALSAGEHLLTYTVTNSGGLSDTDTAYFEVVAYADIDNDSDGFSESEGDCDDADQSVAPGATEYFNERDDDCDGLVDEGTEGYDDDGDGYVEVSGDCDDTDEGVFPGATEECDGVDQDCDLVVDDNTVCFDDDGDGDTELDGDCDDACASCFQGAGELTDGLDNDCNGVVDDGTDVYDDDGDGYSEDTGDCDDSDALVNPAATEACGDGQDNDCNGQVDEEGATDCEMWYTDNDSDGYGSTVGKCLCASSGVFRSPYKTDCYDGNSLANPASTTYSTTDRGDGDYDYNCDGVEDKFYPSKYSCSAWPLCGDYGTFTTGFKNSVASCGNSGTWVTSCSWTVTSCSLTTSTKTQKCN
jgi:hypothetical protein